MWSIRGIQPFISHEQKYNNWPIKKRHMSNGNANFLLSKTITLMRWCHSWYVSHCRISLWESWKKKFSFNNENCHSNNCHSNNCHSVYLFVSVSIYCFICSITILLYSSVCFIVFMHGLFNARLANLAYTNFVNKSRFIRYFLPFRTLRSFVT